MPPNKHIPSKHHSEINLHPQEPTKLGKEAPGPFSELFVVRKEEINSDFFRERRNRVGLGEQRDDFSGCL